MTCEIEGIKSISEELPAVFAAIGAEPQRHPVHRTSRTEVRQPISSYQRLVIYTRDHFRCVWCGKGGDLVLDHIVPWSAGGNDEPDNLRTLCWEHNEARSNYATPDDGWRPLPITYCCQLCYIEEGGAIPNDSDVGPAFCYWHRRATVGHRSKDWMEANA